MENIDDLGYSASRAANQIDTLGSAASGAASGLNDLDKATAKLEKTQEEYSKLLSVARKGLVDLAETTSKLTGGYSKYGESLENTLGSFGHIMETAGSDIANKAKNGYQKFAGRILKEAGKGLSASASLINESLKQHDALVKSYQALSEFGAIDTAGIEGLKDTLADIGTTAENVEYFQRALRDVAPQLAIFGGTVAAGAKQVTEVVKNLIDKDAPERFEQILTQYGYTTEDLMKFSASYIALGSRNMQGMTRDSKALTQQTFEYLKTLGELAELTGASRDEQQKAQDELQQEIQWRAKLRELAKTNPEAAEKARDLMMSAQTTFGPAVAGMIRDVLAHGTPTSGPNTMLYSQFKPVVDQFRTEMYNSSKTVDSFARIGQKESLGAKKYLDTWAYQAGLSKDLADSIGLTYRLFDDENRDLKKGISQVQENRDKYNNVGDERLKLEVERKNRERQVANTYQDIYLALGTHAIKDVNIFIDTLIASAKEVAQWTETLTGRKLTDRFSNNNSPEVREQQEKERLAAEIADLKNKKEHFYNDNSFTETQLDGQIKDKEDELKNLHKNIQKEEKRNQELKKGSLVEEAEQLRVKPGVNWDPHKMNPETLALMEKIQKEMPSLDRFTSMNENDSSRRKGGKFENSNSLHPKGQAFDFTFKDTPDDAKIKRLQDLYENYAKANNSRIRMQNMYDPKTPNPKGEAPHIHIEVIPNQGGMGTVTGGKIGFNNPVGNSPKFNADQTNLALNQNQVGALNNNNSVMVDNNKEVVAKLDNLERLFNRSLSVQQDILAHTKMAA